MITKNASYNGSDNKFVMAEFGHGSINMVIAIAESFVEVGFKTIHPRPIGTVLPHGCADMVSYKPEIVFRFSKTESIDALVATLLEAKEDLEKSLITIRNNGTENS